MHKNTERMLVALERFVENKTEFPLSLSMINKKLGKPKSKNDILLDRAVEYLGIRQTLSITDSLSEFVYLGTYEDKVS